MCTGEGRGRRICSGIRIIHTGQHYDPNMSDVFFNDLGISAAGLSPGGRIRVPMRDREDHDRLRKSRRLGPSGSADRGRGCELDACLFLDRKKMGVAVAHVEAGLRSFDMTIAEEINWEIDGCDLGLFRL